jgi:NDP-sugar pyrophosphorylase family protein
MALPGFGRQEAGGERVVQVVILAGGLGTRLRPLTRTVPKPMVPVAGRPFLERQLEYLVRQGLRRFLLLTGYLGEQIEEHFGDGARVDAELSYQQEETPLGTGGGLRRALGDLEERFLLVYGDSFLPEDYGAIAERFRAGHGSGLMVVSRDAADSSGVRPNVAVGPEGKLARYHKGGSGEDLRYIEAGVVALTARAVQELPATAPVSLETELYPHLAARGEMEAWITGEEFFDMGTPRGLKRAEQYFKRRDAGPSASGEATAS